MRVATIGVCLAALASSAYSSVFMAEPIPVRYSQGSSHGFVALKTLDGKIIATGESTQTVSRGKVSSRLVFRFNDGSVDDDGIVFTQQGFFRLISDHHIQRGPSFPKAINFLIDMEHIDRLSQPLLRLRRMSATDSVSGYERDHWTSPGNDHDPFAHRERPTVRLSSLKFQVSHLVR
jgi:hypothetical protein